MSSLGTYALYLALYLSLVGTAISFVAGYTGSRRFIRASRFSVFATYGAIGLAGAILLHAFLTHDFSIQYVASYSDESMPLFYLIGAFWGGQAGSLLFWASIVSLFTCAVVYLNRESRQEFLPWVIMVCLGVLTGLLLILVFVSNPFEGYSIIEHPSSGEGLNPLLQTPKMVIHPPMLLTGLASMTVPFAFALAALITGNLSDKWVESARNWILIPWLFLSVGNILGGMWAYEELGWGGYWAWDPVENAAFMPWLLATALIHSLMIQERRGMLKKWNIGLMIGTYLLTVFGTYITRSGLIESVHTFAQSDIGNYFLAFLLVVTAISVALFAYRWPEMEPEETLDSAVSREAAFMVNNWLFLAMTVVVFFGTLWPKFKTWTTGQEVSIGPPWFNRWMVPLGILTLLLMGVGMIIAWRKASLKNFKRDFVAPIIGTVVGTPLLVGIYWFARGQYLGADPTPLTATYAIATVAGCIFATATMIQELWRGVRARGRAHDESPVYALFQLFRKQRRRYGGYLVHFGVVCAFLAFAGNALKLEKDVSMRPGDSVQIGDYSITYQGLSERNEPQRTVTIANMRAVQKNGGTFQIHPGRARFHATPNMPTSEIDIKSTPLEDVYVALVNFSRDGQSASFKMYVNPFTWWLWVAGVILVLGTLIAMWPTRDSLDRLRSSPAIMGRFAVFTGLVALSIMPLLVWQIESDTKWGSAERWAQLTSETANESPGKTEAQSSPPEGSQRDGAPDREAGQ